MLAILLKVTGPKSIFILKINLTNTIIYKPIKGEEILIESKKNST